MASPAAIDQISSLRYRNIGLRLRLGSNSFWCMTARERTAKTFASGSPAVAAASVDFAKSGHCQYVLISPCRDEAEYMRETLDLVISQTIPPAKWIIVDDGSTDSTPQILAEYQAKHDWIEVVTRSDRGQTGGRSGRRRCVLCRVRNHKPGRLRLSLQTGSRSALAAALLRNPHGEDESRSAYRDLQRQGLPRRGKWTFSFRETWRRHVARCIQILPRVVLQGDRWVRARSDVGWNRLSSLPDEWLDRLQLGRARIAFHPSSARGFQPEKHLCRAHAPRLWPIFHGDRFSLHGRQLHLPLEQKAICFG